MKVLQDEKGISLTANEETGIYTLRMDRGPNVVNPEFVDLLSRAIEKVERAKHPKTLVLMGNGKFFSNGLDRFRGVVVWLPKSRLRIIYYYCFKSHEIA